MRSMQGLELAQNLLRRNMLIDSTISSVPDIGSIDVAFGNMICNTYLQETVPFHH
jgi:hypothetical protein